MSAFLNRLRRQPERPLVAWPSWFTPTERRKLSAAFASRKPGERAGVSPLDRREIRKAVRLKQRAEVAERKREREAGARAKAEAELRAVLGPSTPKAEADIWVSLFISDGSARKLPVRLAAFRRLLAELRGSDPATLQSQSAGD